MKIALCFSGGIRNLKDNFESIKKCFLDTLNPDVFIHGWYFKVDELKNQHKMYRGKETDVDLVNYLLKPKRMKLEVYDKFKETELSKQYRVKEVQEKYQNDTRLTELYPNTVGMFYSIFQSNSLKSSYEKEHNFTYDIVIRIRPDFEFYTPVTLETLKLVENKKLIYPLDNYAFVTQMCDKFAIGNSNDMNIYSDLINRINLYIDKYPKEFWDGPSILKKHLEENNLSLIWIYLDYDYHVRKKSQRLTKDKIEKVKYDKNNLLILEPKKYNNSS